MEILVSLAYASFFIFLIGQCAFFKVNGIPTRYIQLAFVVKLFFAVLLGVVYTRFYPNRLTADTFKFFDDSQIMYQLAFQQPKMFFQMISGINDTDPLLLPYYDQMHNWYNKAVLFNDYRFQIRINTALRFISLGFYHVHAIIYSFLSFIGLTALLKLFSKALPHLVKLLYTGTYFIPSVLFWGSGLLKDSLIIFATGASLFCLNKVIAEKKIKLIPLFIFFFLFLMLIKFHNFILLLPLFAAYALSLIIKKRTTLIYFTITIVYFLCLLKLDIILPGYGLMDLLSKKQAEFIDLANDYQAQSTLPIHTLEASEWSAIQNTPQALSHVLFRPFIFDTGNFLLKLAALENLMWCLIFSIVLFNLKIKNLKAEPLFMLAVIYTLSLFVLIGLVTPVMGAIVRYKIQALPFLFFALLYATNTDLLKSRFPVIKKLIN